MKFKHTFHVFVDNFSVIYKHLLYGLIVTAIGVGLGCAVVIPMLNDIMHTTQYADFSETIKTLWSNISNLKTEELQENLSDFRNAMKDFLTMLGTDKVNLFALCGTLLAVVYLIYRFLMGLGNYTTGALINDKMTLQANSSFIGTMIKNLGKASLYNVIYVPVSFLYDGLTMVFIWALFFKWLSFLPILIKIFLFATLLIALVAVKMTFTANWLPSLIHGRQNNRKAIVNNFTIAGKGYASVFSNFLVIILLILAMNVAAVTFTFGAALLLTLPASYVILISFEFVNYYDAHSLKYFIGDSVVGPKKETPPTIEEFFKGEE